MSDDDRRFERRGESDLGQLVRERRIVVCVGTGGVGKTTIAAAIALGAATDGCALG